MSRSVADFWWNKIGKRGVELPKNVAYWEKKHLHCLGVEPPKWEAVTWEEVHEQRTNKIHRNILLKRRSSVVKPCLVWVFSHGDWLMGGYYTIIKTLNKEYYLNFRGVGVLNEKEMKEQVMQCFPLCLPIEDFFYDWMQKFCEVYQNNKFYQGWKNQGIATAYCRINENGYLVGISTRLKDLKII